MHASQLSASLVGTLLMRCLLGVKILEIFPAEIYTSIECRATSCLPGKFSPAAEVTFEDSKGSIFFFNCH